MLNKVALAVLAVAVFPVQSMAADAKFRVDGHGGSLGGGLEVSVPFSEKFNARVGFNTFSISANQNSGGLDYKGDLKLSSVGALVDWRPFSGTMHLTAGAFMNNNKLSLTSTSTAGTYNINGQLYNSAGGDSMTTSVGFNKIAPYLGFGWSGNPKRSGFSLSSDIGVLFQGSPQATVTAAGAWGGANMSQLTSDMQAQMNNDLKSFKAYPVLSIGIGYAF